MNHFQPGILLPVPSHARYLTFSLRPGGNSRAALRALRDAIDGRGVVAGIGESLVLALGANIPGLRTFPPQAGAGIDVPSTPSALWLWVRGEDRGELFHRARCLERALAGAFRLGSCVDAFRHDAGRDLTGYEDGTENPKGAKARAAAIVNGSAGPAGSSFVAVQQWVHRFERFDAMTASQRDNAVGRRRTDNVELANAPLSAHVKRTAQENFEPEIGRASCRERV